MTSAKKISKSFDSEPQNDPLESIAGELYPGELLSGPTEGDKIERFERGRLKRYLNEEGLSQVVRKLLGRMVLDNDQQKFSFGDMLKVGGQPVAILFAFTSLLMVLATQVFPLLLTHASSPVALVLAVSVLFLILVIGSVLS
jgi:hypothetical protein